MYIVLQLNDPLILGERLTILLKNGDVAQAVLNTLLVRIFQDGVAYWEQHHLFMSCCAQG